MNINSWSKVVTDWASKISWSEDTACVWEDLWAILIDIQLAHYRILGTSANIFGLSSLISRDMSDVSDSEKCHLVP